MKKTALLLAALHLSVVFFTAFKILNDIGHDPESFFLWMYMGFIDFPISIMVFSLIKLMPTLPHIVWWPGLAGDWSNFLSPFFLFAIFGTAQWYFIGWILGCFLDFAGKKSSHHEV